MADPTGGTTKGNQYEDFLSRFANVRQVMGREIAEGGKSVDSIDCIIRIRDGAAQRTIKHTDRVRLRGDDFEIVTIGQPDRKGGYIEMTLRRQEGGT